MWAWIVQHSATLQVIVSLISAVVWLVYLRIFIESQRRQSRSEILITLGGERGLNADVLVSNLGLEPIYILDILLGVRTEAGDSIVSVADRTEADADGSGDRVRVSLQQPLKSGDHVGIGSIDDLFGRAARGLQVQRGAFRPTRVDITVAAVTAASSGIAAARRSFDVQHDGGATVLRPDTLHACQIRDLRGRRRVEKQLEKAL